MKNQRKVNNLSSCENKLQIITYFRHKKQNKGEQKTLTNVVPDPGRNSWLKTIGNDLKQMRKMINISELIKFTVKNLYKISNLSKKK